MIAQKHFARGKDTKIADKMHGRRAWFDPSPKVCPAVDPCKAGRDVLRLGCIERGDARNFRTDCGSKKCAPSFGRAIFTQFTGPCSAVVVWLASDRSGRRSDLGTFDFARLTYLDTFWMFWEGRSSGSSETCRAPACVHTGISGWCGAGGRTTSTVSPTRTTPPVSTMAITPARRIT